MSTIRKIAPRTALFAGAALTALTIVAAPLSAMADDHYQGYAWESEVAQIQHGVKPTAVLDARTKDASGKVTVLGEPGYNYVAAPTEPAGTPVPPFTTTPEN